MNEQKDRKIPAGPGFYWMRADGQYPCVVEVMYATLSGSWLKDAPDKVLMVFETDGSKPRPLDEFRRNAELWDVQFSDRLRNPWGESEEWG